MNVLRPVALTVAMGMAAGCSGGPSQESNVASHFQNGPIPTTNTSVGGEAHPTTSTPESVPVEKVDGLSVGDKITNVTVLSPEAGVEKDITLTPKQTAHPEDLGVIYSPEESKVIVGSIENAPEGVAMGRLLTAWDGKVTMSFVVFEESTKEVIAFSPNTQVITGLHIIFIAGGKQKDDGYLVALGLGEDPGTARVVMDGTLPYEVADEIKASAATSTTTTTPVLNP